MCIYILKILFPCRLLQNIEYCSLCYTVGPCWLSTSYIVAKIFNLNFSFYSLLRKIKNIGKNRYNIITVKSWIWLCSWTTATPIYISPDLSNCQILSTHFPTLLYYFELNPRPHIISSVSTSICISKKITTKPKTHLKFCKFFNGKIFLAAPCVLWDFSSLSGIAPRPLAERSGALATGPPGNSHT